MKERLVTHHCSLLTAHCFSGPPPAAPSYLQEKRLGPEPQGEPIPSAVVLLPPQANVETTLWGFESPHLGHGFFKSCSVTP